MNLRKQLLFIGFIITALHASGQGWKKQRIELIQSFDRVSFSCDSICKSFEKRYCEIFEKPDSWLPMSIQHLSIESGSLFTMKKSGIYLVEKLVRLDRLPKGISLQTFDTVLANSGADHSLKWKELNRKFPVKRDCRTKSLYLDSLSDKPRKSDLAYLNRMLQRIETEKDRLLQMSSTLDSFSLGKDALLSSAEEQLRWVKEQTIRLEDVNEQLYEVYKSTGYEFVANGPKGYSQAFFDEFPDFFPDGKRTDLPIVIPVEWKGNPFSEKNLELDSDDAILAGIPPPPKPPMRNDETVLTFVEQPAGFPGGMVALQKYIAENFRYPQSAYEEGIEGKCYLQFVVEVTGAISNVEVKRGVKDCPECDEEAVRLVKAMPKWNPGKNGGEPVKSLFNLPIIFKID